MPSRTSSSQGSSRPSVRRKRPQLNPAFAAAHGIPLSEAKENESARHPPSTVTSSSSTVLTGTTNVKTNSSKRLDHALNMARSTGKLNVSNMGLHSPLPDGLFDLRSGIQVDYSLDSTMGTSSSSANPWDCYGEEMLVLVDFSDNDLSSPSPSSDDADVADGRHGDSLSGDVGYSAPLGMTDVSCLDSRIERYRAIQTLRARRCNLTGVPLEILRGLECLTVLDLSGNEIRYFPFQYVPLSLRELDLSSNYLLSLVHGANGDIADVDSVILLPNLTQLDVTDNRLTEIPTQLRLEQLHTLRFGENSIQCIPNTFIETSSQSLNALEGPKNKLSTPPDLSRCRMLRIVDFCDNCLTTVPCVHPSLVRLALSNNEIRSLDGMFPHDIINPTTGTEKNDNVEPFAPDLVELRLRRNKLTSLNEIIVRSLVNMTLFDVGENDLRDIPYVIGYLPALRKMPLDCNRLRIIRASLAEDTDALKKSLRKKGPPPLGKNYLPEEGGEISYRATAAAVVPASSRDRGVEKGAITVTSYLVGSHTLRISNKQLTALPQEILRELSGVTTSNGPMYDDPASLGSGIHTLEISRNLLRTVDEEWVNALPNLSSLDVSYNQLSSLPKNMGKLPIKTLLLNRNRLTFSALSASPICSYDQCLRDESPLLCHKLVHLDLSCNQIDKVPAGLFQLSSLSTLNLSYNKITTLEHNENNRSGWRSGLPSLEHLDLSNNQIQNLGQLPLALSGCTKLRTLMLHNNELRSIPPTLGLLQTLHVIDLRGNPQRAIRVGILDRSCDEILKYLRSRMGPSELDRAKERHHEVSLDVSHGSTETRGIATSDSASESKSIASDKHSASLTNASVATTSGQQQQQQSVRTSPLAEELRNEIDTLTVQLNNVHLTEAKKYAMKKQLAMQKAKLIREERRIRQSNE